PNLNALRTIGYAEPIRYLRGEISRAEMVRLLKRNSRRYAKRQLTWFRRFPEYTWLNASEATSTDLPGQLLDSFRAYPVTDDAAAG
ncbi:MAG TPA: tRNA dimethylallyltransferase, partial [Rhodothermales bacterium]|nr:tRNA dimethylallyltransferase [Rhodothermales bacterium]